MSQTPSYLTTKRELSALTIYHTHHILPKHMGGDDSPENLISLTVEEHAYAHLNLYYAYGNELDWIAYQSLTKQISINEAKRLAMLESAKRNHPMRGKKHSEISKMKMAESTRGKNNPMWGKYGQEHPAYGYKKTKEQIEKTTKSHRGMKKVFKSSTKNVCNG